MWLDSDWNDSLASITMVAMAMMDLFLDEAVYQNFILTNMQFAPQTFLLGPGGFTSYA